MPLYEYECQRCLTVHERMRPLAERDQPFMCDATCGNPECYCGQAECGGPVQRVVSKPGYRRDHTVLEK
jgi:predicted nucleic acid-binding Zn ribbon protein